MLQSFRPPSTGGSTNIQAGINQSSATQEKLPNVRDTTQQFNQTGGLSTQNTGGQKRVASAFTPSGPPPTG